MIISRILTIFAGRGLTIAAVAGLLVTVGLWDHGRMKAAEQRGVMEERARVDKKSTENATKADRARRSAEQLPASSLLDKRCRDCR